ncbi:pimeloyl-ACP methyl ester carboxylesterase [Asanoa ferruginea]|uniref:Pimeloyl-ACP methyl ester carboxylesterase n=1 Tax=Asanoa ferruginea TaxID=53367 RepID=A0A3D9ZYL6_9ACTN|nr:alpha/beta hydrolase [Asanoa ferruginea]REG01755.1 pimeloyl-ACP methyl ester carboxylesterase [Asanoa ferruginea]GIF49212.1 alpha/beta hydrolase [Asanoa ferruginea]
MTEELFADVGRGIELCYTETGDPAGRPLLLVMGLGQQLIAWPDGFVDLLASRGFRVITFDNRDAGRSTHAGYRPPPLMAILRNRIPADAYNLGDLGQDTVGLLDALGLESVHIAGVSMGGMIAQTVAARFPQRVRTLTSIMSTTGARKVGRPALSTWIKMGGQPPRSRDEAVARAVRMFRHIGSHGFPFDEESLRARAGAAWDRDRSPAGLGRQLTAIFASGDRTDEVRRITVPTLVVHGDRDRMVHPSGGRVTHQAIAGSRLVTIPGLGHDCPAGVWPRLVDLIDEHAQDSTHAPA